MAMKVDSVSRNRFMVAWLAASLLGGCVATRSSTETDSMASSEPSLSEGEERLPTEVASDEDSPFAATSAAGPVETAPSSVALKIEKVGDGANQLLLEGLDESMEVALERTAPSEYILRLPGLEVAASGEPHIAPPGEGAIRSARIVKDDTGALLRIFAQPDHDLTVERKDGAFLVSANSFVSNDDARAQFKPEEKASEPAAEPAPKAEKPASEDASAKVTESPSKRSTKDDEDIDVSKFVEAEPKYTGRLISLDLQDTDIDNALRVIAEVSNLNIISSEDVAGKITLHLIDVPWDQALDVILKTNALDKVQEGNVIRIAPVEKLRSERESLKQAQMAEEELEPLQVKFVRVSYAKAADIKALIDSVLTERGSSTFDERTNQIIVKDIGKGVKNVATLISKVDLRTPQVLLETQIVEATRSVLRELGARVGFQFVQSPGTGNATGRNFPNSAELNGNIAPNAFSANPIGMLFGSADGSKTLGAVLNSLESEGKARIISRPAVSTTNNKQAIIKSVEKARIRLPQGGVAVATGQGAAATGQGQVATEIIEVGIILQVTAQASPDYYVLLDISAKSSTFSGRTIGEIQSEVERSATSSVLVSSGQTFALGGIYKTTQSDSVQGIPFFKDIPFFGHFFRYVKSDNQDEELLFFLTPRIVEGSFDDSTMKATSLF
jgi:type IV pilus secretin PilQ/predicted competence protein